MKYGALDSDLEAPPSEPVLWMVDDSDQRVMVWARRAYEAYQLSGIVTPFSACTVERYDLETK